MEGTGGYSSFSSASVNLPYNQCVPAESNQGLLIQNHITLLSPCLRHFFVLCQIMRVMTSINNSKQRRSANGHQVITRLDFCLDVHPIQHDWLMPSFVH